ncbi:MAG: alcohol dehydrogenase catalytic domain-containing protein [Ruminococcus sp.]
MRTCSIWKFRGAEGKTGAVKIKVQAIPVSVALIFRVYLHNGVHFYPIVLGHEFSGDVVEVGEGVTR